ncbi:hypothetical protein E3P99_00067 [Wallemia hederae]|uniref:RING-type E3 ubiquitin transferase n=1 Tax=Wallemia hederae TaxID=1540922 RepID=A0A4T0FYQ7_9BASI|nr:hypothetical protein E3P99_00067 [Wallemia hederae]
MQESATDDEESAAAAPKMIGHCIIRVDARAVSNTFTRIGTSGYTLHLLLLTPHLSSLREWLNVTKKQHCEICKHSFGFIKVYSPTMPNQIPRLLFFKRALICVAKWFTQLLHFFLVAFVWLGLLPYVTVWCWRWYFYFGNALISTTKRTPVDEGILQALAELDTSSANATSDASGSAQDDDHPLKSIMWTVLHDIFQGQTITCSLVVIFVVIFLLREWVLQQGPINDPWRAVDSSRPPPPLKQILDEHPTQLPTPPNLEVPLNERLRMKKRARQLLNPLQIPNSAAAFNISDNSSQTSETTTSSSQIKQRRISDIIREDHLAHDVNVAANLPLPDSPAVAVGSSSALEPPSSAVSRASSLRSNTAAYRTNAWVTDSDSNDYLSPNTASNSSALDDESDDNWEDRLGMAMPINANQPLSNAFQHESDESTGGEYNHRELDRYFIPDENEENNDNDDRHSDDTHIVENEDENEDRDAGDVEGGIMDDELDGLFEAVGLRGPIANLFQNSSLMILLFFIGIGCFIFLPYTIGKIFAQLRPIDIPLLPIQITRWFTDPIFDLAALLISKFLFPSSSSRSGGSQMSNLPAHIKAQNAIARSFAAAEAWVASQQSHSLLSIKGPPLKLVKGLLSILRSLFATKSQPDTDKPHTTLLARLYDFLSTVPILRNHLDGLDNAVHMYTASVDWVKLKSWSLALKDGTSERILSILLGYTVATTFAAIYLNTNNQMLQVANVVKEAMTQQVILAKIAVLFASELVLFPLACGILLEICSMPLYADINFQTRLNYTVNAPITSLFTKWLCGTLLLFLVSVLITGIRKLLRPGVLWFIRDPNDPNFAPMRDVLERSAWTHVRKLAFSAFLYSTFIMSTFGVAFYGLRFAFSGVLPLRWKMTEPISIVPVDLLFLQFVMPYTIRKLAPRELAKSFYATWWRWASAQLGLSSFMFGGRHRHEETRYMVFNWRTMFGLKHRKRDMRVGNWMRVPATDDVSFDRRRPCPMLVAVDETGYPVDERGERAVANQLREASFNGRDPAKDWCVVYAPPNFKRRLLWFIAYLWATTVTAAIATLVPSILLGRYVMDNMTGREMHDIYCLIVGLYGILAPPILYQKFMKNVTNGQVHRLLKSVYYIAALGLVLPTLLGVTLELSAIIPAKYLANTVQFPPRLHLPQAWCLGLLVGRLLLFFTKGKDVNEPVNLINKMSADGFESVSLGQFNQGVVKPVALAFGVMFVVPTAIANYSIKLVERLDYDFIKSAYIHVFAFPLTMALLSSFVLRDKLLSVVSRLDVVVRDEEFLVERQLQNAD